jgi:hypothetical protein
MTEEEWAASTDPGLMLVHLRLKNYWDFFDGWPERKLRLYAAACCRRVRDVREDPVLSDIVGVAERMADGLVDEEERSVAREMAEDHGRIAPREGRPRWSVAWAAVALALGNAADLGWGSAYARDSAQFCCRSQGGSDDAIREAGEAEEAAVCDIIRDLFVLLTPPEIEPSWRTPTVLALAGSMYRERDFDPMPILGDALEEAGCQDPLVLGHARAGGGHVKGCWLIDGLLGYS